MDGEQIRAGMGLLWALAVFGGAMLLGLVLVFARRRTNESRPGLDHRGEDAARRLYDEAGTAPPDR